MTIEGVELESNTDGDCIWLVDIGDGGDPIRLSTSDGAEPDVDVVDRMRAEPELHRSIVESQVAL